MQELEKLWMANDYKSGLKVRYVDWDFKHKYFIIHDYTESGQLIKGTLDNGEEISFAPDSQFWEVYESGREENAKAV